MVVEGDAWDRSSSDVCIAGLGWVGLGLKGQAELRVWRYPEVAITTREAMLPVMARRFETRGWSSNTKALGSRRTAADKAKERALRDASRGTSGQAKRPASAPYTPAYLDAEADFERAARAAEVAAEAAPVPEFQPVSSVRASKRALRKKVKQRAEGVAAGAGPGGAQGQAALGHRLGKGAAPQRAQWPAVGS